MENRGTTKPRTGHSYIVAIVLGTALTALATGQRSARRRAGGSGPGRQP